MKKIDISLNQNYPKNSLNILKQTKNIKPKEIKYNILNQFKKRFLKKKISPSSRLNTSNTNHNTNNKKLSTSSPYKHILGDLIQYLRNKIDYTLYEDINSYVHKKINTYNLENNINGFVKKRKAETDIFSDNKYKSYINFKLKTKKNKVNIGQKDKNINIYKSIKSNKFKTDNYLKKLMASNDCINRRIKILRNKENRGNKIYDIESNSKIKQDSIVSFDHFYNGSKENLQNISCDYNYIVKKRKANGRNIINNKALETNDISGIKLYKRLKPINYNNARLNNNIKINLQKIRQKKPNKKKLFIYKDSLGNEETKKSYDASQKTKEIKNLKLYTFPCNTKLNKNKKEKIKSINKTFINNNYKNDNSNNNNIKRNNILFNFRIGKRSFINNKTLLNKKLINKLKLNLIKNKKFFNNINKLKSKLVNNKKTNLFNEFGNKINKINRSFINNNINLNSSNIKKTKSYRLSNGNIRSVSSIKKRNAGKANNKNIISKLKKNSFLNIVNNITNKKNINDKKYIHISSIEINNIIKSDEQKGDNTEIMESNHKFKNIDIENDELMKKIKNSIDDNLKVMLNFSYENFLSKESDRDSKDFNYNKQ